MAQGGEQVGNQALFANVDMQVLDDFEVAQHAQENQGQDAGDSHANKQHCDTCAVGQETQDRYPQGEENAIGGHHEGTQDRRQEIGNTCDEFVDGIFTDWHRRCIISIYTLSAYLAMRRRMVLLGMSSASRYLATVRRSSW